ncbi:MAG TPA: histidine phosphatase family protein [Candidatus Saccharimonadales bacterium]|nr:histidine phosphatase family protein [Candidatus Saccharimonadales bacterium]
MTKTTLILIRHGETNTNVKNVLHMPNDKDKLTEKGTDQMKKTSKKIKHLQADALYSSVESRALESADFISQSLDLKVQPTIELKERNWGDLSGKPWVEVENILNQLPLEERYCYTPTNGESWQKFEERLVPAIKAITEKNQGKKVVIVTHGGSIRALMPYLLNIPKEESFKYYPRNASLSIFELEDEKINSLVIDDISHL